MGLGMPRLQARRETEGASTEAEAREAGVEWGAGHGSQGPMVPQFGFGSAIALLPQRTRLFLVIFGGIRDPTTYSGSLGHTHHPLDREKENPELGILCFKTTI